MAARISWDSPSPLLRRKVRIFEDATQAGLDLWRKLGEQGAKSKVTGNGEAQLGRLFDNNAIQGFILQRLARLQVLQHRGLDVVVLREPDVPLPDLLKGQRDPGGVRDGDNLLRYPPRQLEGLGVLDDRLDRAADQRIDRVEGRVPGELRPQNLSHVGRGFSGQAASVEERFEPK